MSMMMFNSIAMNASLGHFLTNKQSLTYLLYIV